MKIQITAPINPAEDYTIYTETERLSKPKNTIYSHFWDDSDIAYLLTDKQFNQFLEGKFQFDVPNWKINLLTFKKSATNNEQLRFISQFI